MARRRRAIGWVISGCVLAILVATTVLSPTTSPSLGRSIAFLKGAKPLQSSNKMVVVNGLAASGSPPMRPVRFQKERYRLPLSFEEVKRISRAEFLRTSPKSEHGVARNRDYWIVQLEGRMMQIATRPHASGSGTEVLLTCVTEPTVLDKAVSWIKKLFGR